MSDRPRQDQACPAAPGDIRPTVEPASGRAGRPAVISKMIVEMDAAGGGGPIVVSQESPDALFRSIVTHLDEALVVVDAGGTVVHLNDAAARLFGPEARHASLDQWPTRFGIHLGDEARPCDAEALPVRQALRGRAVRDLELFVRNPRVPRGVWLRSGAEPLEDASGVRGGAVWILRDMTRRRRVEQALAEERLLLERHSRRQAALADIELAVNTPVELAEVLDHVVRLTVQHLPTDAAVVVRWCPEDSSLRCEASSMSRIARSSSAWGPQADGGATRWIVEHDQPLTVSEIGDDPFRLADLFVEAAPRSYAGVPLTDEKTVVGVLYALDRGGRRYTQEDVDFLHAIASRASTALMKVRLYDQLRDLNAALRRRTAELAENERRFRTLADNAPVLIWMTDPDDAPTYFNRTWLDFSGRDLPAQLEAGWGADLHPDDDGRAGSERREAMAARRSFTIEYRRRQVNGKYRWLTDTGTPRMTPDGEFVGYIGSCTDITVRKDAEAKLRRHREHLEAVVSARTAELKSSLERLRVADRLATIGTLTAGLGHDMNNLLFPIRCRLESLNLSDAPPDLAETLEAVSHTVEFLQQLSDGLRLFARDPDDVGPAGAVTVLEDWWEQVRPLITKCGTPSLRVVGELDADLPPVCVAPHRLTQAVLNLVVNASEAMPGGGTVRIRARASDDGRRVRIGVSDEGTGMSEEVRLRAFDPFFSTKTRTLSTGLGLSIVHGVVKSVGGSVDVDSEIGRGTTVVLSLPAASRDETTANGRRRAKPVRTAAVGVVDPRRRAWISRCLEGVGFEIAPEGVEDAASVFVLDATTANLPVARRFLRGRADRRVIGIGAAAPGWKDTGAAIVGEGGSFRALQAAVESVTNGEQDR